MSEQKSNYPVAGKDYPRNILEFNIFFSNEEACRLYLEHLRWPEGFICPFCKAKEPAWRIKTKSLLCRNCRKKTSATAGTVFEGTRKPLRLWFYAMWELTSQKYGANALGLQRVLGLGGYLTAWAWLHKLRRAMVRPGRDSLFGTVEIDESYVGGVEEGVRGRETDKKAIIVIAVEMKEPKGFGRIRLRRIPDVASDSLVKFVSDVVKPNTVIHTDGWQGYAPLKSLGFNHKITIMKKSQEPAHVLLPGPHRISALLKRWLLSTYQGAVTKQQLDYYLDEYTFRFNRRTSRSRGLLFYRLVSQAAQADHIFTRSLFKNTGRGRRGATN